MSIDKSQSIIRCVIRDLPAPINPEIISSINNRVLRQQLLDLNSICEERLEKHPEKVFRIPASLYRIIEEVAEGKPKLIEQLSKPGFDLSVCSRNIFTQLLTEVLPTNAEGIYIMPGHAPFFEYITEIEDEQEALERMKKFTDIKWTFIDRIYGQETKKDNELLDLCAQAGLEVKLFSADIKKDNLSTLYESFDIATFLPSQAEIYPLKRQYELILYTLKREGIFFTGRPAANYCFQYLQEYLEPILAQNIYPGFRNKFPYDIILRKKGGTPVELPDEFGKKSERFQNSQNE